MADLQPGDVLAGGEFGYLDHFSSTGVHIQHIPTFDDGDEPYPLRVNGIAIGPDGEMYFALGDPFQENDDDPHDICYVATDPPKLAALVARRDDTLELWTLALDMTLITKYTGLDTDAGWTKERYCKLKVGSDNNTIYYTDRLDTIFRFDLALGVQLAPHVQLDETSPHIYAGFDIGPGGDIVIAVTNNGNGPRNAVATDSISVWCDEINPDDETYHVLKLGLADFGDVLTHAVSLDPAGINGQIRALAVYVSSLRFPGFARHGVATNRVWFFRSEAL
jgi:hypothetical protein